MTDEHTDMVPEEPAAAGDANAGEFTTGEGLIALGALLLVAVWIIFDLITDDYGMNNTVAVIAAGTAILPRVDRAKVERLHPLPLLMKALGYTLALFGVTELLLDLFFNVWDFTRVIAALAAYAGYVMAFMGARQID